MTVGIFGECSQIFYLVLVSKYFRHDSVSEQPFDIPVSFSAECCTDPRSAESLFVGEDERKRKKENPPVSNAWTGEEQRGAGEVRLIAG